MVLKKDPCKEGPIEPALNYEANRGRHDKHIYKLNTEETEARES